MPIPTHAYFPQESGTNDNYSKTPVNLEKCLPFLKIRLSVLDAVCKWSGTCKRCKTWARIYGVHKLSELLVLNNCKCSFFDDWN